MNIRDTEFFVKVVNMMVNDAHYLLDEVLMILPKIKEEEAQIDNREEWASLSPVSFIPLH